MMTRPVLVFDIETVPDVAAGRRLLGLEGLSDAEVVEAMKLHRYGEAGTEFQRHHLHRIVAISVVLKTENELRVWSLGTPASDERELVQRFFEGIERFQPTLVSWNGSGFDLPVLHYRALLHGVEARSYWDTGHFDRERRWDNYISRYQFAHVDLMDVLAGYQMRAAARLDEIAVLLGLPGKMGQSGAQVTEQWLTGDIESIRNYCETDVVNTYLIWLQFERMRGRLTEMQWQTLRQQMHQWLRDSGQPHLMAYAQAWRPEMGEEHGS